MNLLQKDKPQSKDPCSLLAESHDVWKQSEEFSELVKRELNRSRRSGQPLSSVVIDLSGDSSIKLSDNNYKSYSKELIKVLTENTRFFDIKYYCSPCKIGILLIDTDLDGAKAFIEKISRILHDHYERLGMRDYGRFIRSTSISISPLGETEEIVTISASLAAEEDPGLENKHGGNGSKPESRESRVSQCDWKTRPVSKNDVIQEIDLITNRHRTRTDLFGYRSIKRSIDLAGSIAGIIIFAPLMLLISIAIKATSKGPVLFKQRRVGSLGKPFTFLKFRTMKSGGDDTIHREYVRKLMHGQNEEVNLGTKDKPLYKLGSDPRVTKVGWILRKTSLDELPQFFNVLIGDMSLVGPRPSIFYEAEEYKNWHWLRVMETKPGITGIWQVSGRSRTTFDEMIRLDLQYIEKQSIPLDLKILVKTFGAVFNMKGAM